MKAPAKDTMGYSEGNPRKHKKLICTTINLLRKISAPEFVISLWIGRATRFTG
jgi:hypothetical protein